MRPSAPQLDLSPERSRVGQSAALFCLLLSLIATLTVPMAGVLRAVLLLLLIPAVWHIFRPPRWHGVRYVDSQWRLRDADGIWHDADLLPDTLRHRWLVVLRMRIEGGQRLAIPLFRDALPAADHSALRRVLLRSVSPAAR